MAETHTNQTNGAGRRGRKAGGAAVTDQPQTHTGPSKRSLNAEASAFKTDFTAWMKSIDRGCRLRMAYAANHGIDLADLAPEWPDLLEALKIETAATATATAGT